MGNDPEGFARLLAEEILAGGGMKVQA